MRKKVVYLERQRFRNPVTGGLILVILGVWSYTAFRQFFHHIPMVNKPMSDEHLWLTGGLIFFMALLLALSRLELRVMEDRLLVKFFPFHWRFRVIMFDSLESIAVRSYRPLWEFGGWGLRFSLGKGGTAYTLSGKSGLQLVFKNGKKLLIGTRRPERLQEAVHECWIRHQTKKQID